MKEQTVNATGTAPAPRPARQTALLAAGSLAAILVLAGAALGLSRLTGHPVAGAAVVLVTFAACIFTPHLPAWARALPSRWHPAPRRRTGPGRDAGVTGPILTGAGAL
jgi:hypothetical protein